MTTKQPKRGVTKGSVFTWLYNEKDNDYDTALRQLRDAMAVAGFEGVAK